MKRLNDNELKTFAVVTRTFIQQAKEIADIFYKEKSNGNHIMDAYELNSVDDYCNEYECNWYRYNSFDDLVNSEIEQGAYGLTRQDCEHQIGKSIFKITGGWIQSCF